MFHYEKEWKGCPVPEQHSPRNSSCQLHCWRLAVPCCLGEEVEAGVLAWEPGGYSHAAAPETPAASLHLESAAKQVSTFLVSFIACSNIHRDAAQLTVSIEEDANCD